MAVERSVCHRHEGGAAKRISRYPSADVFARVSELANQTDPVLLQLDQVLNDDPLDQWERADLAQRYRITPVHGRHSPPAVVLLGASGCFCCCWLTNTSTAGAMRRPSHASPIPWSCA